MTCPCACGRSVKSGNRYAAPACALRVIPAARMQASRRRGGHEGGRVRAVTHRARLLDRLRHFDRDEAIWRAWQAGLHARRVAWQARARKVAKAA